VEVVRAVWLAVEDSIGVDQAALKREIAYTVRRLRAASKENCGGRLSETRSCSMTSSS
jgi:hypothetical protein